MKFGRVEGLVEPSGSEHDQTIRLTVFLDTGDGMRIIRQDVVPPLPAAPTPDDLAWQADQYTQETIGVDLAAEGWEVVGVAEARSTDRGGIASSATYVVRRA
jgi:hypothetical protein